MQPMQLYIFSGKQFEGTFKNTQRKKAEQMQPVWLFLLTGKSTDNTHDKACLGWIAKRCKHCGQINVPLYRKYLTSYCFALHRPNVDTDWWSKTHSPPQPNSTMTAVVVGIMNTVFIIPTCWYFELQTFDPFELVGIMNFQMVFW